MAFGLTAGKSYDNDQAGYSKPIVNPESSRVEARNTPWVDPEFRIGCGKVLGIAVLMEHPA